MRVYTYSQVSVVFRVSESFSSFSFRCYHEFQLKSTWVSKFLSFLGFHGFLRFYVVFCGFLGHKTEKNSISQLLMSTMASPTTTCTATMEISSSQHAPGVGHFPNSQVPHREAAVPACGMAEAVAGPVHKVPHSRTPRVD
jgi:hypothetical protein